MSKLAQFAQGGYFFAMKRVTVIGTGAVALYYGGRLAVAGHDVRFLARSGVAEMRRDGLRAGSVDGDFFIAQPQIETNPARLGPQDAVLVAIKSTGNAWLREWLPPLVDENTTVITLQNGLGNAETISQIVAPHAVMGALCFVCINRIRPGEIQHTAGGKITLGDFLPTESSRREHWSQLFSAAGVPCEPVMSLEAAIWRKLVWNVPFNGLAITEGGKDTAQLLACPATLRRIELLMQEVCAIAAARGYPIEPEWIDQNIARTRPMRAYKPSSLIDWQAGREVELDAIWGVALRHAIDLGVSVPQLQVLWHELQRRCGVGREQMLNQ